MQKLRKFLIWLLCVIAAAVFGYVFVSHQAIWWLVALYWLVLTIKNSIDVLEE